MRRKRAWCKVPSYIYCSEHTAQIMTWNQKQKGGNVSFSKEHPFTCCWRSCLEPRNDNTRNTGRIQQGGLAWCVGVRAEVSCYVSVTLTQESNYIKRGRGIAPHRLLVQLVHCQSRTDTLIFLISFLSLLQQHLCIWLRLITVFVTSDLIHWHWQ